MTPLQATLWADTRIAGAAAAKGSGPTVAAAAVVGWSSCGIPVVSFQGCLPVTRALQTAVQIAVLVHSCARTPKACSVRTRLSHHGSKTREGHIQIVFRCIGRRWSRPRSWWSTAR